MDKFVVWGYLHGNNTKIKLFGGSLKNCQKWKKNNVKYYDNISIYKAE